MCLESQKEVATKPSGYGVVAIIRRENLFLAIRRGKSLRAGGMVCFPGGHIEQGEREQEAVIRECREELSIDVVPQAEVWKSVTDWGRHCHGGRLICSILFARYLIQSKFRNISGSPLMT